MRFDPHSLVVWIPWALLTLLLWGVDAGWRREHRRRLQAEHERNAWAREAQFWQREAAWWQRGAIRRAVDGGES